MSNHMNREWSEDRRRFESRTVLPLSISLAVSSSSLASSNYEGMRSEGRPSSSLSSSSSSNVSSRNKYSRPPLPPPPLQNMTPGQLNNSEFETDPIVLARRQKQIDYGKNTQEYANYLKAVPLVQRGPDHPRTPPMHRKYSRRAWDGLIKQWRLNLHCWTYPEVSLASIDDGHLNFSSLLPPPSRSNLNDSFSSDVTSHSTSTTSSMAQALAIFSDYQIPSKPEEDGASRLLKLFASQKNSKNNNNNVPGRPSSSLCFAENRDRDHELAQTYYSNRQAFSQTDLSSSGGLPRERSGGILWPTEKQEAENGKGDLMKLFKYRFN